jgi:voltage-gated potassium channel Kch
LPNRRHPIAAAYLHHRYAILFYSLLLTLAAGPLLTSLGFDLTLLQLLFTINLLAAIAPYAPGPARRALIAVVILGLGLRSGALLLDSSACARAADAVAVLVALQAVVMTLRFSTQADVVDKEHVYAALGAYMLMGIFFGVLFAALQNFDAGNLAVAGAEPGAPMSFPTGIYFSFVTLATLGYGDIVPKSDLARGFAILEAVAGQLYLAVLVARLVGMHRPRSRNP